MVIFIYCDILCVNTPWQKVSFYVVHVTLPCIVAVSHEHTSHNQTQPICLAGTICYPQLLVRSRMQDQHRKYNSLRDCLVLTLRNEGILGFYKGLTPNLLRTIPASVITFYTYELIRSNS